MNVPHRGHNVVRRAVLDAIRRTPRSYDDLMAMTDSDRKTLHVIVHRLKRDGLAAVRNAGTRLAKVIRA